MKEDPTRRREREFDAITFLLAGVLSAIVLGAVGFGVYNSSKVAKTIPAVTTEAPGPAQTGRPNGPDASTTGSR